jgi:transposase
VGDVEQVDPGGGEVVQGQLEVPVDLALKDAARFGLQLEQQVLGELRRFLGGEKATLLWDRAAVAPAAAPCATGSAPQRSWLVVERLPAYAPELNPVEGLWSSLKAVELANLTSPTLAEVIGQAHKGVERLRRTPHLAYSFLRHAGLSDS